MWTLHDDGFTSDAPDLARSGRFTEPERGMTRRRDRPGRGLDEYALGAMRG
jgi:hypothetical protein